MGHTCTCNIVLLMLVLYSMENGINSIGVGHVACSARAYLPKVLPKSALGSESIF